jgi:hypothetical protein
MVVLAAGHADAVIMQRWPGWMIVLAACGGSGGASSDDTASADAQGGVGEPAELAGITLFHNQVRAMVATTPPLPALAWDASLAATAAAWVARCQDTDRNGLVDHNPDRSAGHPWYVGENLFASTGDATAHDAVLLPMYGWAAEQAHYHYDTNTCDGGASCGHYTQVVWRATQKLGCALHRCPGLTYPSTIVCDYGPGGNVNNEQPY